MRSCRRDRDVRPAVARRWFRFLPGDGGAELRGKVLADELGRGTERGADRDGIGTAVRDDGGLGNASEQRAADLDYSWGVSDGN